jgi:transposase
MTTSTTTETLAATRSTLPPMDTVGLDVSEKFIQFHEVSADGEVVEEGRFRCTADKLRDRFGRMEERRVVLEVGSHSRWITEVLLELGHTVLLLDPRRLKLIAGTLYKDDTIDAEVLASLGWRVPEMLKTVRLREAKDQKALTLVRSRGALVESRTKLVNTVRGVLKPYGIRLPKEGRSSTFASSARESLPAEMLALIAPMIAAIEQLNTGIKLYDREAEQLLPKLAPDAVHLTQIAGVGALTALYFAALVGDPHRFGNTRNIGAYLGLCRKRSDSGDYKSQLRITKAGDSYMRALLANCASYILGPFGPDCDLRRWGLARIGAGKKSRAEKKKAKTAVSRKLAVLMLTLWKTGNAYDPLHEAKRRDRAKTANTDITAAADIAAAA